MLNVIQSLTHYWQIRYVTIMTHVKGKVAAVLQTHHIPTNDWFHIRNFHNTKLMFKVKYKPTYTVTRKSCNQDWPIIWQDYQEIKKWLERKVLYSVNVLPMATVNMRNSKNNANMLLKTLILLYTFFSRHFSIWYCITILVTCLPSWLTLVCKQS